METLPGIDTKLDAKSPVRKNGGTSERIGPEESKEAIMAKRQASADVPLGKEHDAEYDKKRASYEEALAYVKK